MTKLNFDWNIDDDLYNITVSGDVDDWWIESIEWYVKNSKNYHTLSTNRALADRIEKILEDDDSFIQKVDQEFLEHRINYAEWLRDEEIERKIDENLMNKEGLK